MIGYRKLLMTFGFGAGIVWAPGLTGQERVDLLSLLIIVAFSGNLGEHVGEVVKDAVRSRISGRSSRVVSSTTVSAPEPKTGTSAH